MPNAVNITLRASAFAAAFLCSVAATVEGDWLIVTGDDEAPPVMLNVTELQSGLARIASGSVSTTTVSKLTEDAKRDSNLILAGEYGRNSLARQVLDAHGRSHPLDAPRGPVWAFPKEGPHAQEQGYVVDEYPDEFGAGRKTIVAAGWKP